MATQIVDARTAGTPRETIQTARQRIFEAQGVAQVMKLQLIDSRGNPAGGALMSCSDAIDTLLQMALNDLEPLE